MDEANDILKNVETTDFEKGMPTKWQDFSTKTIDLLKEKHLKVTAAESLTAGLFQATVASVPGASNVFDGGFVTYADSVKIDLLGMNPKLIEQYTVVSAPVAEAMSKLSAEKLSADLGLGFTGVAGPDPLEGNPVGTVFIGATNRKNQEKEIQEFHFTGSRQAIRLKSVLCGFALIWKIL